jgi:hypothetical protein
MHEHAQRRREKADGRVGVLAEESLHGGQWGRKQAGYLPYPLHESQLRGLDPYNLNDKVVEDTSLQTLAKFQSDSRPQDAFEYRLALLGSRNRLRVL